MQIRKGYCAFQNFVIPCHFSLFDSWVRTEFIADAGERAYENVVISIDPGLGATLEVREYTFLQF